MAKVGQKFGLQSPVPCASLRGYWSCREYRAHISDTGDFTAHFTLQTAEQYQPKQRSPANSYRITAKNSEKHTNSLAAPIELAKAQETSTSYGTAVVPERAGSGSPVKSTASDYQVTELATRHGTGIQSRNQQSLDPTTRGTGWAVTWLGTSSGAPTRRRNNSGIVLRTEHQTLLVDCGEATNRQAVLAGVDLPMISNIFITHMHGDHCFGLPGMLSTISDARSGTNMEKVPVRVFGPPGIQDLVASCLSYSETQLAMPLIIAEFTIQPEKGSPPQPLPTLPSVFVATVAPDQADAARKALAIRPKRYNQMDLHEVDVIPGLTWTIPCSHGITVTAAQLQHRVPCWGYVMKEMDQPPRERIDRLAEAGLSPSEALALLKGGTAPSEAVQLPGGVVVPLKELFYPPRPGRKVVLLGDTCDSRAIAEAARGADLLSHEATFGQSMAQKAHRAQHSTAAMAGAFARAIGAATLVLTHFSGRFTAAVAAAGAAGSARKEAGVPQESQDASVNDIRDLLEEAKRAFGSNRVFPAQDFLTCEIYNRQQLPARSDQEMPSQNQHSGLIFDEENIPQWDLNNGNAINHRRGGAGRNGGANGRISNRGGGRGHRNNRGEGFRASKNDYRGGRQGPRSDKINHN